METLKVYQKWEDMLIYLYIALKNYPRSEHYTLAARTTECATRELRALSTELERFAREELRLEINPKSGIDHARSGIPFCGFRIKTTHLRPRRATVQRAARRLAMLARTFDGTPEALARARASVMSFLGHLKHCDAATTARSILARIGFKGGLR